MSRTVSTRQVDRAVTAAASHFDRRDAIRAVAGLLREGAPGPEVERMADAFLASEAVIQISQSRKGPRYTTRRIWELEREALAARDEGLPATSIAGLLRELDGDEHDSGEGLAQGSVLLIDEAGMVDSATLGRLVSHVERAEAKLVLVGDPEQLGEIEAGGLFRATADRIEPIWLDEVIRHEHELDREAAKRIREGEGPEALLYRSEERVTVSPDAEARREAMVHDWHESFDRGEDAMMIAKRNAEVERLNAMAREVRKQAGKLRGEEIEVGEVRFAVGDQVITRINDQRADIYNRERWRIAEVDAEQRRLVLDDIDHRKRVEVGAEYLARTNPHSDAPALEHAYAVTTYSAQGSTVDRAFVMADPSMDKQELYVATSRSREETYLYATPEVQAQREEIAPESPYLRKGTPHIAEAAERDRAQLAAHDAAQLEALPISELVAKRRELEVAAAREVELAERRSRLQVRIEQARERLEGLEAQREASPRRQQRRSCLASRFRNRSRAKGSPTLRPSCASCPVAMPGGES